MDAISRREAGGTYSRGFYSYIQQGSLLSAREIVPLVMRLISPASVVDIGCGVGTWLAVFQECGVHEILGVDGEYVDRGMLHIPAKNFAAADLQQALKLDRQFDLAVSVEVAEHLPPECAEVFVASLCRHAPVVLFSAAIPQQGGNNHLNEQWPEYWADLFSKFGYVPVDCIRRQIWNNPQIEWWYCQNIILYAAREWLVGRPDFHREFQSAIGVPLPLVHPRNYLTKLPENTSLRQLGRKLSRILVHRLRSRLRLGREL